MSAALHTSIFKFAEAAQWVSIGGYIFVTPTGVLVEIKPALSAGWHICLIVTPRHERGKGFAHDALMKIIEGADLSGAVLTLIAQPKMGSTLKRRALIGWYRRHGFSKPDGTYLMTRQPRKCEKTDQHTAKS